MIQDTILLSKLDSVVIGRYASGVNLRFKNKEIEDWCNNNLTAWDLRSEYLKLKPYHQSRYVNVALLHIQNNMKIFFKLFWVEGNTDFSNFL